MAYKSITVEFDSAGNYPLPGNTIGRIVTAELELDGLSPNVTLSLTNDNRSATNLLEANFTNTTSDKIADFSNLADQFITGTQTLAVTLNSGSLTSGALHLIVDVG